MKTRNALNALTALTLLLAASGCQTTDPVTGDPTGELTQHSAVSDCGGFEGEVSEARSGGYCDAEVLAWTYEADTSTLELIDRRVSLNCCGERSISAELIEGVLVVTEIDAPEPEMGRCRCMCVFDFALTIDGIQEDFMAIELLRSVAEDGDDAALIWSGDLDLTAGSGEVVLDDSSVMDCSE